MARLIQLAQQDIDTIRWELSEDSDQEAQHFNHDSTKHLGYGTLTTECNPHAHASKL